MLLCQADSCSCLLVPRCMCRDYVSGCGSPLQMYTTQQLNCFELFRVENVALREVAQTTSLTQRMLHAEVRELTTS